MATKTKMEFSMTYSESADGGYIGIINEVPGVMSQGESINELKMNLTDALKAMFEYNRISAKKQTLGTNERSEKLQLAC